MTPNDMRSLRRTLGWSQTRLSEALGVNRSAVARWETGVYPIDKRTTLALEHLECMEAGDRMPELLEGNVAIPCIMRELLEEEN